MKRISILCLLGVFVLFACKKSKDDSWHSILTSKKWVRSYVDKNPESTPKGPAAAPMLIVNVLDCESDNEYAFNSSKKYTIDKGDELCYAGEEQTVTADFSLDEENKELILDNLKYTIFEITHDQIKLYRPVPTTTGFSGFIYLYHPAK